MTQCSECKDSDKHGELSDTPNSIWGGGGGGHQSSPEGQNT